MAHTSATGRHRLLAAISGARNSYPQTTALLLPALTSQSRSTTACRQALLKENVKRPSCASSTSWNRPRLCHTSTTWHRVLQTSSQPSRRSLSPLSCVSCHSHSLPGAPQYRRLLSQRTLSSRRGSDEKNGDVSVGGWYASAPSKTARTTGAHPSSLFHRSKARVRQSWTNEVKVATLSRTA